MKLKPLAFILVASLLLIYPFNGHAEDSTTNDQSTTEKPTPVPTQASLSQPTFTPVPETAPFPAKAPRRQGAAKALVIHKPMPSPSWGKVIQYHRDQIFALTDKNREILHEFLFQDDEGVVRTATFHENADGTGYWEVWVWDQQ